MQEVGVAHVTQAFCGAHVQPDAQRRIGAGGANAVQDAALVPPDGGAHDGGFAEDFGVGEGDVEGDETAEGAASECGVGGVGEGAERGVDEGFELFDEEFAVEVCTRPCDGRRCWRCRRG
jgi:hypothetical protein